MKYLKLTLFIIVAAAFVFRAFSFYLNRNLSSVGGAIGAWITFFALVIILITGIITVIVLLKSPKNYFYIFLVISSIPFFNILFQQAIEFEEQLKTNKFLAWRYQLDDTDLFSNLLFNDFLKRKYLCILPFIR